jgi:hypothetical protein
VFIHTPFVKAEYFFSGCSDFFRRLADSAKLLCTRKYVELLCTYMYVLSTHSKIANIFQVLCMYIGRVCTLRFVFEHIYSALFQNMLNETEYIRRAYSTILQYICGLHGVIEMKRWVFSEKKTE